MEQCEEEEEEHMVTMSERFIQTALRVCTNCTCFLILTELGSIFIVNHNFCCQIFFCAFEGEIILVQFNFVFARTREQVD